MAHRSLWRRRFYLLPKEPYQFGPEPEKNSYLIAVYKFMKNFDLKNINRIDYAFDPFHENAKAVRNCMFYTSGKKVRESNPKCAIRSSIRVDRSDPTVRVQLANGQNLVYNASNLTELEILQHIQKTSRALEADP